MDLGLTGGFTGWSAVVPCAWLVSLLPCCCRQRCILLSYLVVLSLWRSTFARTRPSTAAYPRPFGVPFQQLLPALLKSTTNLLVQCSFARSIPLHLIFRFLMVTQALTQSQGATTFGVACFGLFDVLQMEQSQKCAHQLHLCMSA